MSKHHGQCGRSHGRCSTSRARTRCAGTSTPPARRGCPPASPPSWSARCSRKFMGTLWNTYAFFTMYAAIDDYKPAEPEGRRRGLHADGQVGAVQAEFAGEVRGRGPVRVQDHRDRPRHRRASWTSCPTGTCACSKRALLGQGAGPATRRPPTRRSTPCWRR